MFPTSTIRFATVVIVATGWLATSVRAQTPVAAIISTTTSLGSISGTVRDELGAPVEATVTITTQGLRQERLSAPDGTFQFPSLHGGKFILCARSTGRNAKPQDDPFVDGCLWHDSSTLVVSLLSGRNVQDVIVPVKHGATLKVRINDPGKQLPAAVGNVGGNHLVIGVIGPSGLVQDVPIARQDAGGRDHEIAIPRNTPHKVLIRSTTFIIKDNQGRDIESLGPTSVLAPLSAALPTIIVNVVGRKP